MILILLMSYLALLIALQVLLCRRYGWKGLLGATLGELAFIFGGGAAFWAWWTWGWGPFETRFAEHPERYEEGIVFAVMWQIVPSLLILCSVVVIASVKMLQTFRTRS